MPKDPKVNNEIGTEQIKNDSYVIDEEDRKEFKLYSTNFCTCLYTNADSLLNKRDELLTLIQEIKPNVISITEVRSKGKRADEVNNLEYSIDGYDMFLNDKPKRGVAIYTEKKLNAHQFDELNCHNFEENVFCTFKGVNGEKVLIGCLYRSPNSSDENKDNLFNLLKSDKLQNFDKVCITGDFNFPTLQWNGTYTGEKDSDLLQKFNDTLLFQKVKNHTRRRGGQTPSLLDLVLVSEDELVSNITHIAPLGKSDHDNLIFQLYIPIEHTVNNNYTRYIMNKGNYKKMRDELSKFNWEEYNNISVEAKWDHLKSIILKLMNDHIPKSTNHIKKDNRKRPHWMNSKALRKIKKKFNLYKRFLTTKCGQDYQKYVEARNECKRVIKKAKKNHEKKIAENSKSNPKMFWRYVQDKLKSNVGISVLHGPDGELKTTDKDKADVLNEYFSSVFTREDISSLPDVVKDMEFKDCSLTDLIISKEAVENKLKKLDANKANGPDQIPPRVLKELSSVIAEPLTTLFNQSIQEGKVPNDWKNAEVVAIYKNKGARTKPNNYRPVSLTCILCKVLESIVRDSIVSYFKDCSLYSDSQHGFRHKRSCISQLIQVMDDFSKMIEEGKPIDIIYLDFQKAFDQVPHERLLIKLKSYGIDGIVLKWIRSFLSDRKQWVKVGSSKSLEAPVLSGIPQGSILGPVLFTIFINDLPEGILNKCKIFADDTKLYGTPENKEDIQRDLIKLQEWSDKWNLRYNVEKCKVLHIGQNNPEEIYMMGSDDKILSTCDNEKDLGVTFDKDLSFDVHIQNATKKANRALGLIRRAFDFLDKDMFIKLYKALVRPHLEYGNLIWHPRLKRQSIAIENVQRRATKILNCCKDMTYTERLKFLKLPTLKHRRQRGDLIETFKIFHGHTDISFQQLFRESDYDRTRNSEGKLTRSFAKKPIRAEFFTNRIVNIWNALAPEIKFAQSINNFKNLLDMDTKFTGGLYCFDGPE